MAHSRGWLDYEERVCMYWPEFAQEGKETITVRHLLAHQAGLFAINERVDRDVVTNLDELEKVLARQKPAWPPGERQAYHALSLGFFEGALLRRIDPKHRSLGQFFQEEIATPLGLDFYINLPNYIPNARLAKLVSPTFREMILGFPIRLTLASIYPRSNIFRALVKNPGSAVALDEASIYARNLEVPAGGGVGTARAIARAYSDFATGGKALRLQLNTLHALYAPAVPSVHGFYDECMKSEMQYAFGFFKPGPTLPFGHDGSFGAPGAGGAMGYADPQSEIGYAYVTNRMGTSLPLDPRDIALRNALSMCI
jgi:CubicO group peptidase (beta-lactamase class C family)